MTTAEAKSIVKAKFPDAVLGKWLTGFAVFTGPGCHMRIGTARTQPSDAWITAARAVKGNK